MNMLYSIQGPPGPPGPPGEKVCKVYGNIFHDHSVLLKNTTQGPWSCHALSITPPLPDLPQQNRYYSTSKSSLLYLQGPPGTHIYRPVGYDNESFSVLM